MSESKRYTGTVKWFNPQKGFGFITPDDSNADAATHEDLFVHHTSIMSEGFRTLYEGQSVEFSLEFSQEDSRLKAVDVSVLDRSQGGGRGGRGWYGGRGWGRGGGGGRRGGYGGGMGGGGGGGGGGVECYNCGRVGHLARECYQGQGGSGGQGRGRAGRRYSGGGGGRGEGGGGGGRGEGGGGGGYGRGGYGRGGGRRGCFNCGEEGHLARDCPNYGYN